MTRIVGPRVLVQRIDAPKPKSDLIECVSLMDTPSNFAVVIAVGSGELLPSGRRRPIPLQVGDTIVTQTYCGTPVSLALPGETDKTDLHIVQEEDVLAVVTP